MLPIARTDFRGIAVLLFVLGSVLFAGAQNAFNSGSSGADGAFAPTTSQTIVVPDSGIFNYTTVNIPAGITITYIRNTRNTPVTILAQGNVTITGTLRGSGLAGAFNGIAGAGGPGGFGGGQGGFDASVGTTGDGPGGGAGGVGGPNASSTSGAGGGGYATAGSNGGGTLFGIAGPKYGSQTILPLIGGSGGGGGGAVANSSSGGGGGGGGAILIASSASIIFNGGTGTIDARGGNGGTPSGNNGGGAGGGSGGAIRLVANTISGGANFLVTGGLGGSGGGGNGGAGGLGYIRVEAFDLTNFSTSSSALSSSLPNSAPAANAPQLKIASIAGVAAPALPLGSLQGAPDIVLPTTQPNPVNVVIEGTNVPVGTVVQITLIPATGTRVTAQSSALAGTSAASTATASVSLPSGLSVIAASAVIDMTVASAAPMFLQGEKVDRIEVAASFGGASEVTYVTHSGRRIPGITQ